jgi:hypothetical protein
MFNQSEGPCELFQHSSLDSGGRGSQSSNTAPGERAHPTEGMYPHCYLECFIISHDSSLPQTAVYIVYVALWLVFGIHYVYHHAELENVPELIDMGEEETRRGGTMHVRR